jgi:DNA helicase-2/ATP-dependent DNA helicase PcrA
MESAHIKDLLAHLRVMVNKEDSISMGRILRLLQNIGPGKSQAIIDWMKSEGFSPQQIDHWPRAGRNDEALKTLAELLRLLNPKKTTPLKAVEAVRQYYEPILRERFDDFPRRAKDLEQLAIMAGRYEKLRGFLDDLMLEPPTSSVDITREDRGDCLTLSTVHSAKGLEWSVVYILWAMEGYFPSGRAYGSEGGVEEERRLMYVAATRAKDRLFVCYPGGESRPSWSSPALSGAVFGNGLSSFIRELPESVMAHTTSVRRIVRRETAFPTRLSQPAPAIRRRRHPTGLMQGDRVRHPAFGAGVISRFLDEEKVEVLFRNAGRKLLHLEYTTLEKI